MKRKALKALKASISGRWYNVVFKKMRLFESGPCDLCEAYNFPHQPFDLKDKRCRKCPVYKKTGRTSCHGTPYNAYVALSFGLDEKEAMDEFVFLCSLLPNSETVVKDEHTFDNTYKGVYK